MAGIKGTTFVFIGLLVMGLLVATIGISHNASAATITVGGPTGQYANIQDAIDDASDGDTIFVAAGTYNENIVIDKKLAIVGNDTITTIINGTAIGSAIVISADWVTVSGITVINSGTNSNDAGIMLAGVNNCTIRNVTVSGNRYGMFLTASNGNSIYNNNFIDNIHNAYDDGLNTWNLALPAGGNYWDDFDSDDGDENGVMDTAYLIPGGSNKDSCSWTGVSGWEDFVQEEKFEADAVSVMFIGMGVVFAILTILWITTHLTGVLVNKFESKKKKPGQGAGEIETVAAIAAAIKTSRE